MATKGFKSINRKIKKMQKDLDTKPIRAAENQLQSVRSSQVRQLLRANTFASGTLAAGLTVSRVQARNSKGQFTSSNAVSLESTAPYSGYVEYGTGERQRFGPEHAYWDKGVTYQAPSLTRSLVMNIQAWMIMKGITPLAGDMETSAFLIARQISDTEYPQRSKPSGTPAQPFFWYPLMIREHIMRRRIRQAVRRSLP